MILIKKTKFHYNLFQKDNYNYSSSFYIQYPLKIKIRKNSIKFSFNKFHN